jgi:DNA invertase Pin-like site-specific DNA recombinase
MGRTLPELAKMKRAVIYARVSRSDQSIDLQLDEAGALVERRGWTLVETYRDEGISGAKASRPGLDAMFRAMQRGKFDVLIVWRSDRLFRSLSNMVATLGELSARNVDFVSVMEPFDTLTPSGKLLLHVVAAMAEFERALIAERSTAGIAAARRRGARLGRPTVPVDVERARELLASGLSRRAVARELAIPRLLCPDCFAALPNDGSCCDDCGWSLGADGIRRRSSRPTSAVLQERQRRSTNPMLGAGAPTAMIRLRGRISNGP